ncbi:MAG: hypothetical protein ABSC57_08215 [Syntrophales bacterium]
MKPGPNTKLPKIDHIPDGNIILIRFIRSDRMLDIFGEKFMASKDLVYSYVKAIVITDIHTLAVYLGITRACLNPRLIIRSVLRIRLPAETWS